MAEVKVIESRIYKVYFRIPEPPENGVVESASVAPIYDCSVLALTVREALAKVEAVFPTKDISSIHDGDSKLVVL